MKNLKKWRFSTEGLFRSQSAPLFGLKTRIFFDKIAETSNPFQRT